MILLENRGVLKVTGEDAEEFLQGLITNDIKKLAEGGALYAAMLSPQGKYLFDFIIFKIEGAFFIDVLQSRLADLLKRLNMYKLRSKLEITDVSGEYKVYVSNSEGVADPRNSELGKRMVSNKQQVISRDYADYELARIKLGVPDSQDFTPDKTFILQSSFEEINGVDFNKGCYVGQEVTARTKYKGNINKRIYKITGEELPAFDAPIKVGDKIIGEVKSTAGKYGLALCDIEEVSKGGDFAANGKKLLILV